VYVCHYDLHIQDVASLSQKPFRCKEPDREDGEDGERKGTTKAVINQITADP
jgi:hypothetical protein